MAPRSGQNWVLVGDPLPAPYNRSRPMLDVSRDVGHVSKAISIAPVFGVAGVAFLLEVERQPPKLIRPLGQAEIKRGLRCPLRTVVEIVECQPDLRFGERDPPGIVILERFRPCVGPG